MKKLIVIADYCSDTLVTQELRSAIEGYLKDPSGVNLSFVASFPSTIHTAYLLNQVITTEERYGRPHETVIFVNTDPRLERHEKADHAEGSRGLIIKLKSGLIVTGPNAGYCFSLIIDKIERIYTYSGLEKGSQFRSRDNYPPLLANLMDYLEEDLDLQEASESLIPNYSKHHVGHIDNYGNLKTTIAQSQLKGKFEYGDNIEITISGARQNAKYVDNLFGGSVGELVIYPGSSGNPEDRFLEISAWSHFGNDELESKTGRDFFPNIAPGQEITI